MGEYNYGDGKIYIKKELAHPVYSSKKPPDWNKLTCWPDNIFPKNKWVGIKVVVRNIIKNNVAIGVKTEVYRDLTDALNGGDFKLITSYEDRGGWTAKKDSDLGKLEDWISNNKCSKCKYDNNSLTRKDQIFTEPAHSVYIRQNNIYESKLKKFSVREIDSIS